mmetsp:Transcript_130683/g.364118  ORF Transcript_130683/g.364118 Transcript_130683/m.364118 type:complete len:344 (-) Transcript_130683:78-1109(-)|eukprot:CAMPEP_0179094882 /NCGR_PEP_ID=MMETSP0796-20121207/43536_1 /TAXON_ID=73915 /ORGANISM="Pyrodinium bahamense, Strain pbaha01" /LENGTH=343 /DNA_ID=CAMNT_0020792561 /DNA_START=53 /DNA_END=1084 /DNA_ORIENTATION=-
MAAMRSASLCALLAYALGAELAIAACDAGAAGEGCAVDAEEAAMVQVKVGRRGQAQQMVSKAEYFGYTTFQLGDWATKPGYELCSGEETPDAADNQWQAPINFNMSKEYEELSGDDYPTFYAKDGGCKYGYFNYKSYAWQVNFNDGENVNCTNLEMEWSGKVYELIQFHFHTVSEDTFDYNHHPIQMHLVHVAEDGSLAVVGVQVDYPTANKPPNKFLTAVFDEGFKTNRVVCDPDLFNPYEDLLAEGDKLWHYQGSLTTPPCTPGVNFLIMQKTVSLDRNYVAGYEDFLVDNAGSSYGHNNRPAQPLNNRIVSVGEFGAISSGPYAPPHHLGSKEIQVGLDA